MKRPLLFGAGILACAIAACGGPAPEPAAKVSSPPPAPVIPDVAVYVTNETSGDLSIIDAGTGAVVGKIALGKRPRGLVASPDHRFLYVALSGSPVAGPGVDESTLPPPDKSADGIGVVDLVERKLLKVLTSGSDPEQVAINAAGTQLYVANEDVALMSVIDIAEGKVVETFKVGGEPEGVSVDPSGRVWVTSEEEGAVYVIDVAAHKVVKPVKVGPRPRSVAFAPDGSRAYVPSENGATITVIDARRLAPLQTIKLGEGTRPMGTVMSADGSTLYVSTGRTKMVMFLDPKANDVIAAVEVGPRPWGIALSPDGRTIFTANGPSNDVSVLDIATKTVTKKIPVERGPWGVVVVERAH